MKCLFPFGENSPLPQVVIPDIAHGIRLSDLVVHPAAALCSFPLASLSGGFYFILEDHKNILSTSTFDVYSPGSLAVNSLVTADTKSGTRQRNENEGTPFECFSLFGLDWLEKRNQFFENQWLVMH